MKQVIFNPVAIVDLDEITSYISQDNESAAADVRAAIFDTAEWLGHHPGLGITPRFSSGRHIGIRFIPCDSYPTYLLFYLEAADEIEILRVLHGSRNLPQLFE